MKEKGLHEGCVEQIVRLYRDRLYGQPAGNAAHESAAVPVDEARRIRIDDCEMREDVQKETKDRMDRITEENLFNLADVDGFKHDFMEAHGFDVAGVDYEKEVNPAGIAG
jgi:enoyl-[acyl-carrier protein] reductase/trans-2-enoyl-CoA reductase (NAD+)